MARTILITGASGYIGSRLLRVVEEGGCMVRRLARRPARVVAGTQAADWSTFTYSSVIEAPATAVFQWHEQPGALAALTPAALVRVTEQAGGIRDGGRVTLSIGVGRARVRWVVRHHGYLAGRRFCDEQVHGPFAVWRHAHLFEPISRFQMIYQDRIEFAVFRHRALNRLAAIVFRPLLALAFARRHRIVRASVGRGRSPVARRWAAAMAVAVVTKQQPAAGQAQAPTPVRTVPIVDLHRYVGDWFEIARFPNRFQRRCVGEVRASYARRADGRLDVVNRCRTAEGQIEAHGVARIVDTRTSARLQVRFAPAWLSWLPVWGDYWIIGLAPDYSWAVVGDPSREYLWILARTPHLEPDALAAARETARTNGFDIERLVQTPQIGAGPS
jgi:apolipoprotein D and lipocalin family protein